MGGAVVIRKRDQRIERHRPRLKEQQRAAETLFDDLLAFVNHKPADDDSEDVRDHLESTLDRIIRATNQDRPVSLHNWMSFRVLRTVKDSQVREIPDEREPLRLYQYAIYELFVWKRSSDVRRCDYPPCRQFFLRSRAHRSHCSHECQRAYKNTAQSKSYRSPSRRHIEAESV